MVGFLLRNCARQPTAVLAMLNKAMPTLINAKYGARSPKQGETRHYGIRCANRILTLPTRGTLVDQL
jgi:hypothetical protein